MYKESDGLHTAFEYATELFDEATVARLAGHYRQVLEQIVERPDSLLSELDILTPGERHQLLVEWNDTATEYSNDACIHELFEAQVKQTPDAVAVVFEDERLTYEELNQRANQLAHYLREQGVGPDVIVGLCIERSLEMIVGILGILKAGGAYLPLDPEYPAARINYMLEDAHVDIAVSRFELSGKACRCSGASHQSGRGSGQDRSLLGGVTGVYGAGGSPRLCHLYLRIHRQA